MNIHIKSKRSHENHSLITNAESPTLIIIYNESFQIGIYHNQFFMRNVFS
jgi:hypothetical protein